MTAPISPIPLRRLVQVYNGDEPKSYQGPDGRDYHFVTQVGVFVARPAVGDYYVTPDHRPHRACAWTNCDGRHLVVSVPTDGHEWSPSNRASNCTLKTDTLHRCWVLHGDPEVPSTLHVDKAGFTCTAGAGSIKFGDWHGFLDHGLLKTDQR